MKLSYFKNITLIILILSSFYLIARDEIVFLKEFSFQEKKKEEEVKERPVKVSYPHLKNPPSFKPKIQYDPSKRYYKKQEQIGENILLKTPEVMTSKEYSDYELNRKMRGYYKNKSDIIEGRKESVKNSKERLLPIFTVKNELFETIFGGEQIDIKFKGNIATGFSLGYQHIENPILSEQNRGNYNTDMQLRIAADAQGTIGTRFWFSINYDTQATFNFQNQMKVEFKGGEDDIIKSIEVGNVSLPLNSNIMRGAQALFGVKSVWQFGNTKYTGVFSQQQSETKTINTSSTGSTEEFEIYASDYEENKHFFLGQYFYENYDDALRNIPYINSQVNITKIEVWVTNRGNITENTRNIIGFRDIGENTPYKNILPNNDKNNKVNPSMLTGARNLTGVDGYLNSMGLAKYEDYSILENAKLLNDNEYTFHPKLGYISLRQSLGADQVIVVSYQYAYNGKVYQVGEFSTDGIDAPKSLYGKLIKSDVTLVNNPIWKLMMKNVYNLNAYGLSQDELKINVFYFDDEKGMPLNYLRDANNPIKDEILLKTFGFDRLNKNGDPTVSGDGYFDYIEGITIDTRNSLIIFPNVEPFGKHIKEKLGGIKELEKKYVYNELYTTTKFQAKQNQRLDKFLIRGKYKISSGGGNQKGIISLGSMNVPKGSVQVTSGGREIEEGKDYTVDYKMGQVRIINEALISSNAPIEVSLENSNLFGLQTRTFMGLNVEHKFNENLIFGGTIMNLRENPITQKSNIGFEPVSNTMFGVNFEYQSEIPFLTRVTNFLIPYKDITSKSNISIKGEYARLMPGSPNTFEVAGEPAAYIDDFEATQFPINIKGTNSWYISSAPKGKSNDGRANLSWYTIDPLFFNNNSTTPENIVNDKDKISSDKTRQIRIKELYPQTDIPEGTPDIINTLDLSYFPNERGPYNYDAPNLNGDGTFKTGVNLDSNWAGITRSISTPNFEEGNIETIQFWVIDPFSENEDRNHEGFKLYINLGSISEDVIQDGRKSFENGLPEDGNILNQNDIEETQDAGGRTLALVPKNKQDLANAFTSGSINNQDLGLDGMTNNVEKDRFSQFLNNFSPQDKVYNDPSGDNFLYFRSSIHDNNDAGIIERYRYFNNPQGNTSGITMPEESYPVSAKNNPDTEDINRDQTLNTTDSYFEYEVPFDRNNLNKDNIYISDILERDIEAPNGDIKKVKWYQFKIPINDEKRKSIGNIADFRSIRFVRMYISESKQPVTLRFAELQLMRSEWRRYTRDFNSVDELQENSPTVPTKMEIGAVNIEENSYKNPFPYVLPPGIERQEGYTNTNIIRQNEQSLSLRIKDLESNDRRAVFKETKFDFRRYKKIKMFTHLEGIEDNISNLGEGDISMFIRIGGDLSVNYYEYEISLTPSRGSSSLDIWPKENNLDLDLSILQDIKIERDKAIRNGISVSNEIFTLKKGNHKVHIKGFPNYSEVKNIMIGVKNNSSTSKDLEVWVNELRLTGLDTEGGWASYGQLNTNFADFADVSLVGQTSTSGFGGIEQSNSERSMEDINQYDFATTVNLGMLLPKNKFFKLNMPLFYNRAEIFKNPFYDPLRPDIEMSKSLEKYSTQEEKDRLLYIAQDYTRRTNFNFSNFKIETEGKKSFYSLSNFILSYSDNELFSRNIDTEFFRERVRNASITYAHSTGAKPIEPFKKMIKSNYLALIRDFNFNYLPTDFNFKLDGQRDYTEEKFRDLDDKIELKFPANYVKKFTMNYSYGINYNLMKNLRLSYSGNRNNIIDEPEGVVTQDVRDSIWKNILSLGRPTKFNQNAKVSYKVPFDKIPFTKFISGNIDYTTNYEWTASKLTNRNIDAEDGTGRKIDLGNNIQNAQTITINTKLNFKKIYKGLERAFKFKKKSKPNKDKKNVLKNLKTKKGGKSKKKKEGKSFLSHLGNFSKDILFMVKDVSGTYTSNRGTNLPGYLPESGYFGRGSSGGPTFGFMFGSQNDIRYEAIRKGWLTPDAIMLNDLYSQSKTEEMNFKASIEPIKKLKITLNANRSFTSSLTENYSVSYDNNDANNSSFTSLTPSENGNLSMSFLSISTSFKDPDALFDSFLERIKEVATLKANEHYKGKSYNIVDTTGYPEGFQKTHSEVLIASFLSTYGGDNNLDIFRKIPLPNWRIRYTGLKDIKFLKKYFRSITLNHAYSSNYKIGSFQNDLNFNPKVDSLNLEGNLITKNTYGNISLIESFSPLLGVSITLKNKMSIRSNYKKDRALSLSLNNNSINEIQGEEYTIGVGYVFKDIGFTVRTKTRRKKIKSDINFKVDFSMRNNKTIMRKIIEEDFQITAGEKIMTIRSSADYKFSSKLVLRAFYEYSRRDYEISTSYPTINMRVGVNVRFNLD